MYRYIFLILITLFSCTQYTAITPIREYNVVLENSIVGVDLFQLGEEIYIKNVSSQLIIKLDYIINGNNIIIHDSIVPEERIFIVNAERKNIDIIINDVIFY